MAAALVFVSNSLFKFVSNVNRTSVSILWRRFTKPINTKKPNGILYYQQVCLYCLIFYLYFQSKQLLFCIKLFLLCHQEILSRCVLFVEQHSYKLQLCYLLVKFLHHLGNVLYQFLVTNKQKIIYHYNINISS